MDVSEAIGHLRKALQTANLPPPQRKNGVFLVSHEKDELGNITAATPSFCVGWMEASIRFALEALGEKL